MARRSNRNRASLWGDLLRAVVTALFIISLGAVFVLYFRPLYYLDIRIFHLDTACGLDAGAVRRNYDALCDYMFLWNRNPLTLPDFAMSEHGRIHFADCKRIFDAVQILCAATGIFTLAWVFLKKYTRRCLLICTGLTIAVPSVLGLLAVFRWDSLFVAFHTILFRNDYWLFDPRTDPVILALPDAFFFQCAAGILLIVLAGGIWCFVKARKKKW